MRVGLAGYVYGATLHAPLIEAAGGQITCVCTSNEERVAQARAAHPDAAVVPDLEAMVAHAGAEGDIDVVVLATPTGVHVDHALAVIEAGLPVVVDKPLAVNAFSAQRLVEAAVGARVPLTVCQNRRYDPGHLTARRLLEQGSLGDVRRLEMRWERWRPDPKHRWREDAPPSQGGGIMLDLHSHLIDAAIDLLGPVEAVYAQVANLTTTADDEAFVICHHTGGATSHLWASSVTAAPGVRMRVLGSEAAYVLDEFEGEIAHPDLADASPEHSGWIVRGSQREPAARAPGSAVDFYSAVADALHADDRQAAMPVDPRRAVEVLAIIDAARISSARRRVIDL